MVALENLKAFCPSFSDYFVSLFFTFYFPSNDKRVWFRLLMTR